MVDTFHQKSVVCAWFMMMSLVCLSYTFYNMDRFKELGHVDTGELLSGKVTKIS